MTPPDDESALLKAPLVRVPTGTSIRFVILVITAIVATGSIFGYFWQVSQPGKQAKAHSCISPIGFGSLGQVTKGLSQRDATGGFFVAACLRSDAPSLVAWSLAGIILLVTLTAVLYRLTPWWMINVGRPGSWRRLTELDTRYYPLISQVESLARLDQEPVYLLDKDPALLGSRGGRAFGYRRQAFVQLDLGLLAASGTEAGTEAASFEKVLLHELAHLRNGDIPSTYLTLAVRRAFAFVIPAGYVTALLISGSAPSLPDPRTLVAVPALVAVVELGARSVLRAREYHADATADSLRSGGAAGYQTEADGPSPRPLAALREGLRMHPTWENRARVLRRPQMLYRPDVLALFTAGVAIGVGVSELNTEIFGASLSMLFVRKGPLTSGLRALSWILLTFGPAALLAAILISWLARDMALRLHYRFLVTRDPVACLRLAAPLAVGMVLGEPLSFSNALAGTWGYFDTSAIKDLAVAGLSAALLLVVLAAVFRWASECAAVWFSGGRSVRTMTTILGAAGLAPVLWAWNINHETSVSLQLMWGPDRGERPLIGDWPGAGALFAHYEPLGAFDIVPGSALLLALPCLFVAAGNLRLRADADVPVKVVLVAGLAGAAVSLLLILDLMLSLHTVLGSHKVIHAGGYGLIYLTRAAETMTALCAGAAAAGAAAKAHGTRLTTGILTALVTVTGTAVFTPYLLYVGFLGWPHQAVNSVNSRVLYGIVGTLSPGRTVVSALVLVTAGGLVGRVLPHARHTRVMTEPHPARAVVAADASMLILMIGLLAMAAYDYLTLGLS